MQLYNIDIERAVLASIVFEPSLFAEAITRLEPKSFYHPFHQALFEAMIELDKKDKPIEESLLQIELKDKFSENDFLEVLAANPLSNLAVYIDTLVEYYQKRLLSSYTVEIKKMLNDGEELENILTAASRQIETIATKGSLDQELTTKHYIQSFLEQMEKAKEAGGALGYKSGINTLDTLIGGFEPGDLVIVAARPSMGKTSFATTTANYALSNGHAVLFDSLEMPGSKIIQRLIATRAEESIRDLKHGEVKNYQKFKEAVDFFKKAPLYLQDESYLTIHQLKARALQKFRKDKSIKFWFIDHLRYIKKPGQNIANEVSEITKELKKIAKDFGIVVFLLSQLNRANEQRANKKPMLSDLRESGAVEEDADIVIGLHRESYYKRNQTQKEPPVNEAELIVLKNRDGEAGVAKCYFNGPLTRFQNFGQVVYQSGHDDNDIEMEVI